MYKHRYKLAPFNQQIVLKYGGIKTQPEDPGDRMGVAITGHSQLVIEKAQKTQSQSNFHNNSGISKEQDT